VKFECERRMRRIERMHKEKILDSSIYYLKGVGARLVLQVNNYCFIGDWT